MKPIILLFTLFLSITSTINANDWLWVTSIPAKPSVMAVDKFGNTFIAGTMAENQASDGFLTKLNANGQVEWTFEVNGSVNHIQSINIVPDDSGNIYYSGAFEGTIDLAGNQISSNGSWDTYLCKVDSSGNLIWFRHWGSADYDHIPDIVFTNMGLYCTTWGEIRRLDANGDLQWSDSISAFKIHNDDTIRMKFYNLNVDTAGNLYMWMTTYFFGVDSIFFDGALIVDSGISTTFIFKCDTAGNLIWYNRITRYWPEDYFMTNLNAQGELWVGGSEQTHPQSRAFVGSSVWSESARTFLGRYDKTGNALWAKPVAKGISQFSYAYGDIYDMATDQNKNLFAAGWFSLTAAFGQDTLASYPNGSDLMLVKMDSNGSHVNVTHVGTSGWNKLLTVEVDLNNDIIVAGSVAADAEFGAVGTVAGPTFFVAKLSETTGIETISVNNLSASVFPNPVTAELTITSPNQLKKLHLTNTLGATILQQEINANKTTLDLANQPTGIYILTLNDEHGNRKTEKIIKQ